MIPEKSWQWRDVSSHLREISFSRADTLIKQLKENPTQNSIQEAFNSLSQLNINDRWSIIKTLNQKNLVSRDALYITSEDLHRSWAWVLQEMQCHGLPTLWVQGRDRPYSFEACCQFSLAKIPLEDLALTETLTFNDNAQLICSRAEWKLINCTLPENSLAQIDIKAAQIVLTLSIDGAQLKPFATYDPFLLIQLENFMYHCEFSKLSPHKQKLSEHLNEIPIVVLPYKTINTVQLNSVISRFHNLTTVTIKYDNELIDFPAKSLHYLRSNNDINIHTVLQPIYCKTQDDICASLSWGFLFDLIGDAVQSNSRPIPLDLDHECVQLALHLWMYRALPQVYSLETSVKLHAFLLKRENRNSIILQLLESFGERKDMVRVPESILCIENPEIFWSTLKPWVDLFPNVHVSFDGDCYFQIDALKPLIALGTLPPNILKRTIYLQVEKETVSISALGLAFCFPALFRNEGILETEQTPIILNITKNQFRTFTEADAWPRTKAYDFSQAEALYQIALHYESTPPIYKQIERALTRCEEIHLPLEALKKRWHQFPLAERITITGCDQVWSRHEIEAFIRADLVIPDFSQTQTVVLSDRQFSITLAHLKSMVPDPARWKDLSDIDSDTFIMAWNHVFHGMTPLWQTIDSLLRLAALHKFYCDFLPPYYVEDLEWRRVNRINYDNHAGVNSSGAINTLLANTRSLDTKAWLIIGSSQLAAFDRISTHLHVRITDSMLADPSDKNFGSELPFAVSLVTKDLNLALDRLHQKVQVKSLILHKPISKQLLSKIALYFPNLETLALKAGPDLLSFEALAPLTRLTFLRIECDTTTYLWSTLPTSISHLNLVDISTSTTIELSHLTKLKELDLTVVEAPGNSCLLSLGRTHFALDTLAVRASSPEGLVSVHSLVDWHTLPNLQNLELSELRFEQSLDMDTPKLKKLYLVSIQFPHSSIRGSRQLDILEIQGCDLVPKLIGVRPTKVSFDQTAFAQYNLYRFMFIRELFITTDDDEIYLPSFNHIEKIIVQSPSGRMNSRTICNGDRLVEAMDCDSDVTFFEDCPRMDPKTRLWTPKPPVKQTPRRIMKITIIFDHTLFVMIIAAIFAAVQARCYSFALIPVGLYLAGKWVVNHLSENAPPFVLTIIALIAPAISISFAHRIAPIMTSNWQQIKNQSVNLAMNVRTLARNIGS